LIANYHTHTPRCGHAVGEEEEYVRHALKRGLKTLGFADHTPYLFPGDYYSNFRMRPEELPAYADTVRGLRDAYRGQIDVRLGVEAEYYPDLFRDTLSLLRENGVEYMLLGQHCCGNEIGFPHNNFPTDREEDIKRYCHQTMEAMNTGLFTYFAHPDMLGFTGDDGVYTRYMRELCREAKGCDMPLEINLLGVEENRKYPRRLFWEIAAEEGCAVVLGCDAHRPEALSVTAPEEKALAMVEELGLTLLAQPKMRSIL